MRKSQPGCMQRHTRKSEFFFPLKIRQAAFHHLAVKRAVARIQRIPQEWRAQRGQMNADLMQAPGFWKRAD